ncbi:AAA ATPase forming ring-shaped complexes [Seminavis robusta]|uniref:Vesicle-fusing ATPase n=1 Tax=Seminavis robusta TaxID=568900 RepID=A0A9N8HJW3_9STRA|nr:AAA ATPase forming ring-shaped complexes [Seminavis robusta]|eukprot:Sro714_g191710.1 AAA ATPase forming ring-shaped complexes (776) ;mRNA; f:25985-28312
MDSSCSCRPRSVLLVVGILFVLRCPLSHAWVSNSVFRTSCARQFPRNYAATIEADVPVQDSIIPAVAEESSPPPVSEDSTTTTSAENSTLLELEKDSNATTEEGDHDDSAFEVLAGNTALCLHKSDLKRDDGFDGASTGWTSWVDDASALRLRSCLDGLELPPFARSIAQPSSLVTASNGDDDEIRRDQVIRWLRWIKACPSPLIIELSPALRQAVNATIPNEAWLQAIDSTRDEFLERIGCRLIVLPSGASLNQPLKAPPGAMVYGKLLLGGVTRFRVIGGNSQRSIARKAGARTLVTSPQTLRTPSWLQYGGPQRNYEAIDAGVAVFMEVLILPKGLSLPLLDDNDEEGSKSATTISQMKWNPNHMLDLVSEQEAEQAAAALAANASEPNPGNAQILSSSGNEYINHMESSISASVGGLRPQIDSIIRRVLDGRALVAAADADATTASGATTINPPQSAGADSVRRREMEALLGLGLSPVRGLLLYGPPGTGKTLVAREIANVLQARPPKIVAAPELLSRWVGGSEKMVRELFEDAEGELAACNGDATKSALHVIVIDEIDAVFRKRSSSSQDSGGEITRASAVNQILSKLDGVKQLGNILIIGMTNRKELLDPALLRPGRLEVQIKIPLPNKEGRREILKIHFEALRRRGLLSQSLCNAIDGYHDTTPSQKKYSGNVDDQAWRKRLQSFRKRLSVVSSRGAEQMSSALWQHRILDLASDRWTGGYSGADIAGLVRSSGSFALARARSQDGGGLDNLIITLGDVAGALEEVKQ